MYLESPVPALLFWTFLFFSFFVLSFCRWQTNKQNKTKKGKYTRRKVNMGAKTLRGIMKVINSYEGDQFSKISFKGRGQSYFTKLSPKSSDPPPPSLPLGDK